MLDMIRRIAAAVAVPVTADVEGWLRCHGRRGGRENGPGA